VDIWNAYEVSWLNERGLPKMVLMEVCIPCDSQNIIESKSFKLYLNSFNQTRLTGQDQFLQRLQQDLVKATVSDVKVRLFGLEDQAMAVVLVSGECIDTQDIAIDCYRPNPSLLQIADENYREEKLHSHLLKSNCPVTGQPDWATVVVDYQGPTIDRAGLLAYIISFREHSDFHEQCVERIFLDILQHCKPWQLTVFARYVRRGGLDINPYRSTRPLLFENRRTMRQ
jgi:7-cyano-7-deazaguanine reductase